MNRQTRDRLRELNLGFYAEVAEEFHETRGHPWQGWQRVLAHSPIASGASPLRGRVLDVGCGNARFARFLHGRRTSSFEYVGLDANPRLLEHAQSTLSELSGCTASLLRRDVLAPPVGSRLPSGPFDLVAAFGFLHHVPAFRARRRLLEELAQRLAHGGLLCITAWRFEGEARYARRKLDWRTLDATPRGPIELDQLEPHDHLLSFGAHGTALRYCHHIAEEELDLLLADLPLLEVDRFDADGRSGRLNRYLIGRRI